jgi:transposase
MENSEVISMAAPIRLRDDFGGDDLRALARRSKDGSQTRRLLSLAAIYDGASRTEAARIGGVGLQVIRDWTLRFNVDGPDGLRDRKAPGKTSILDEIQRKALIAMVEQGPMPAIHGVVRWRLSDLTQWLWEEFRLSVSRQTLGRVLRAQGYAKLSARPRHHSQDAEAMDMFKKISPPAWRKSAPTRRQASP